METDDIENLIYPCKCSGTSKYVHKHCLNQWRTLASNRDAFYKCFECNYKYIIANNNYNKGCFDICIQHLADYIAVFLFFNLMIIFSIYYLLTKLDSSQWIFRDILKNNYSTDNDSDYYLLEASLIYVGIIFILTFLNFLVSKNKKLYLNHYCGNASLFFIFLFMFLSILISSIYLNSFYILSIIMICIQLFFRHHLNVQEIIKRENQMNISNYIRESDPHYYGANECTNLIV